MFIWKNYLIYTVSLNQLPPKYISEFVRVCAKSVLRLPASLVLHVHRIKHSIKLIQQSSSTYILEATLPPPPPPSYTVYSIASGSVFYSHSLAFTLYNTLVHKRDFWCLTFLRHFPELDCHVKCKHKHKQSLNNVFKCKKHI